MRLIQLNVWWGGKLDKNITAFFKSMNPDIICLQESVSFNKGDSALFLSTEHIQKELAMNHSSFAPAFSFNLMHGTASFGNAIISKYPIASSEVVYTNLNHVDNFDFNVHDYNVRNLLSCSIKANGKSLNVLTHHGYHIPDHKNGNAETLKQMEHIKSYISALAGPVILTGDFNLGPRSKSIEVLSQELKNLSIEYKLKTTRTLFTNKMEVCDYIFVNDEVTVKDFSAADDLVSDHKALVVDFDI
jgi:endonuclease/exonuclease/phosphatase family metal-dependent hydrolase